VRKPLSGGFPTPCLPNSRSWFVRLCVDSRRSVFTSGQVKKKPPVRTERPAAHSAFAAALRSIPTNDADHVVPCPRDVRTCMRVSSAAILALESIPRSMLERCGYAGGKVDCVVSSE
jgi:hypothetical protein